MKTMRQRNVAKNKVAVKEQVAKLQTNTNEATKKAKQGHFDLHNKRTTIPQEYLEKTANAQRLDLCMLNDYLNGYTEKMSRANPQYPSEIAIDQLNYSNIIKTVAKKTDNPYQHFHEDKIRAKKLQKEILKNDMHEPAAHLKQQLGRKPQGEQSVEVPKLEKDVQEAMVAIQKKHQRDYNCIENKYMKGTDINKFSIYKAMIDQISAKKCENQRDIKTHHSCRRRACRNIFDETFNGF